MMAMFHSVPRDQWLETTIADIRALMGLPSSPQLDKFTRWFLFLAHLQHRLVGVTDNSKVLNYFAMLLPRSLRARRLSVPLVDRHTQSASARHLVNDGGVGGQKGKRVDSKWSLSYSEGWHRPYFSRRIGLLSCTRIGSPLHACIEWGYRTSGRGRSGALTVRCSASICRRCMVMLMLLHFSFPRSFCSLAFRRLNLFPKCHPKQLSRKPPRLSIATVSWAYPFKWLPGNS